MEEIVDDAADQLLSEDVDLMGDAYAAFRQSKDILSRAARTSNFLPRIFQELAIYQQGSVLSKLVSQALYQPSSMTSGPSDAVLDTSRSIAQSQKERLAQVSFCLLTLLSSSKTFAQYVLRDEEVARKVLRVCCLENLAASVWGASRADQEADSISRAHQLGLVSLEALVKFARASESFRRLMRDAEDLLPLLTFLLEDDFVKKMAVDVLARARLSVADLLMALALATDSQEWLIDKGFLGLLPKICETFKPTEHDEGQEHAAVLCSLIIFRLGKTPKLLCKMRDARVLQSLEPHLSLLDSRRPGTAEFIRMYFARSRESFLKLPEITTLWKLVRSRFASMPTVCSWDGCLETEDGEVLGIMVDKDYEGLREARLSKFSKCGRCGVATYCRYVRNMVCLPISKFDFAILLPGSAKHASACP